MASSFLSLSATSILLTLLASFSLLTRAAVVFNVGLPRTGTTSFHYAIATLNYSSQHVSFNKTRYDLEKQNLDDNIKQFRQAGAGPFWDHFNAVDSFSDTPVYGLIPALHKWFPDAVLVATHRSRESWLRSLAKNRNAGGTFLHNQANLSTTSSGEGCNTAAGSREDSTACTTWRSHEEKRADIYDAHAALLDAYNVTKIDLEDNDHAKWGKLLHALASSPYRNRVVTAAHSCLSELKWPSANQGHMARGGSTRLLPAMSRATLRQMARSCNFSFEFATHEMTVVHPVKNPKDSAETL